LGSLPFFSFLDFFLSFSSFKTISLFYFFLGVDVNPLSLLFLIILHLFLYMLVKQNTLKR